MSVRIVCWGRIPQPVAPQRWCVRFLPGADHVVLLRTDTEPKQYEMRKTHPDGLFEVQVPAAFPLFDYAFLVAFGGQRPVRLADCT